MRAQRMARGTGGDDRAREVGIGKIREEAKRRSEGCFEGLAQRDHGVRDGIRRPAEGDRSAAEEPREGLLRSHRMLEADLVQLSPVPGVHVVPLKAREELDRFSEALEEDSVAVLYAGSPAIVPVKRRL